MTEPKRPGLDEAIEAAARAFYRQPPNGVTGPDAQADARRAMRAAYPIIAAAVRADERAKVLAEVEAVIYVAAPLEVIEAVRALGTKP